MEHVSHEFEPVWNKESRVLVLGTFPSVKSRQQKFYYGHPQNRFWKVTAALLGRRVPDTVEEKKRMLLEGHIAVWDVIDSCDIEGSSDSSIRNVKANDIGGLLGRTSIQAVSANGDKAYQLYLIYGREQAGMDIIQLPSTSPANAAWSLERLTEAWRVMERFLQTESEYKVKEYGHGTNDDNR